MAGLIDGYEARARPFRRLMIQASQLAGLAVERECTDRAPRFAVRIADLADCIEVIAARMNRQERGIFNSFGHSDVCQLAAGQVQLIAINPLALSIVRVGPEESE